MAGVTTGQELKHAASCSAECNAEADSLSIIKLWAAQWGEGGFSLQSQVICQCGLKCRYISVGADGSLSVSVQ